MDDDEDDDLIGDIEEIVEIKHVTTESKPAQKIKPRPCMSKWEKRWFLVPNVF